MRVGTRRAPEHAPPTLEARRSLARPEILALLVVAAVLLRPLIEPLFEGPAWQNWITVFVAIAIQAFPFLVLGVVLSGAIAAFVPPSWLARALPANPNIAVPMAGVAGLALPGCECGSVPIARRLVARGANPPAALTFLLSAPAINPIVIVSTAVAFPGRPGMVAARFVASLTTAVAVGMIWSRVKQDAWITRARRPVSGSTRKGIVFAETAQHDFLHAGGFLIAGAMAAAFLQTVVPRGIIESVASNELLAIALMASLAILLSICSEADAFVAASMPQFSLTSRLVFLVVGPVVDIKLVALQAGTFGREFASRFAPLTLAVAITSALVMGWLFI